MNENTDENDVLGSPEYQLLFEMEAERDRSNGKGEAHFRRSMLLLLSETKDKLHLSDQKFDELMLSRKKAYFKAMDGKNGLFGTKRDSPTGNDHREEWQSSLSSLSLDELRQKIPNLKKEQIEGKPKRVPPIEQKDINKMKEIMINLRKGNNQQSTVFEPKNHQSTETARLKRSSTESIPSSHKAFKAAALENEKHKYREPEDPRKKPMRRQKDPIPEELSNFRSAKEQLVWNELARGEKPSYSLENNASRFGKKVISRVSPKAENLEAKYENEVSAILADERGKSLDPDLIEKILFEIVENVSETSWEDIAGLDTAKNAIKEIVVLPMLRPDLFEGLRSPSKGLLLFGPPGTGKTMIGKCVANVSEATFFSISASSLTSKYIGEGEKMVRTLFTIARIKQPSVIFIDEIDSLLTQRCETEHEASRRLKTEFLVQFDGLATDKSDNLLVIGATNRPQELDEAARRRFVKRLHIPLPDKTARKYIVVHLLKNEKHTLREEDFDKISELTDGYSGADITSLCKEAALEPIRQIGIEAMKTIDKNEILPINPSDIIKALERVKASVSPTDLCIYEDFNKAYGFTK